MSNTQYDSKREYVRKIKDLNLDDPEFDKKFSQINKSFRSMRSRSFHRDNIDNLEREDSHNIFERDLFTPFDLNPFRSLSHVHNNIYNIMNKRFLRDIKYDDNDNLFFSNGEFDENKLDELDLNTQQNTTNQSIHDDTDKNTYSDKEYNRPKYYKYVSSMTTYDTNGTRKAKSISRTEKFDGKNKTVKQVSKFQDGDKYVEEYLNPDGTTRRIEKKINNNYILDN